MNKGFYVFVTEDELTKEMLEESTCRGNIDNIPTYKNGYILRFVSKTRPKFLKNLISINAIEARQQKIEFSEEEMNDFLTKRQLAKTKYIENIDKNNISKAKI